MEHCQTTQCGAPLAGEGNQHAPAVVRVRTPLDKSTRLHAVDQADGAVVANLQPVGQVRDAGAASRSQAAEHEQQLIVLWLESG
jgi:hypothetical protein